MRWSWGLGSLALLLLLALWTEPGHGNEGSRLGSCFCDGIVPPDSPLPSKVKEIFRRRLKGYVSCKGGYVRFQVDSRSVCGGSTEPWVIELTSCLDRNECGHAYSGRVVQQEHSPPPSTQIPQSTEGAPAVTDIPAQDIPAQTYQPLTLQSTQQPTLPVQTLSLDTKLIHSHETTTSSVGHNLETGPEAGVNQKQLERNVSPTAGKIMVLVPVLLGIIFILIVFLLCMLHKRRSNQSSQYSPCEVKSEALHGGPEFPESSSFQIAGNPPQAVNYEGYLHGGP